jgi:hypothetical protein
MKAGMAGGLKIYKSTDDIAGLATFKTSQILVADWPEIGINPNTSQPKAAILTQAPDKT